MSRKRKRFPNRRAIVKAFTIETMVDDRHPSSAVVNLICGHCGMMTSECVIHPGYTDPEVCGVSCEEQEETWRLSLAESAICPRCGVLNVAMPVGKYLRKQREIGKKMAALWERWADDELGTSHADDFTES